MRISSLPSTTTIAVMLGVLATSAVATSAFAANPIQKECSEKYQAAKSNGTLNGMTYNQYYHECAAAAKADKTEPKEATPTVAPAPAPAPTTTTAQRPAPAPTTTASKPAPPAASGNAVFPTAISATFSKESAGKARMHTCLAQYKVNKDNGGNGGLRWIEKGGGYYSECNKRLKS